jgi:hypothetical protein
MSIRIEQDGKEIEITGAFRVYGTKTDLMKMSTQIREQALKVEIGYVAVDTTIDTPIKTIMPFDKAAGK